MAQWTDNETKFLLQILLKFLNSLHSTRYSRTLNEFQTETKSYPSMCSNY